MDSKRKSEMKKMSMLLVLACLLLTGCSTTELEERSFPMLVAIELEDGKVVYKDAFPKEDEMGKHGAKKKDYNHLKVLVNETMKFWISAGSMRPAESQIVMICAPAEIAHLTALSRKSYSARVASRKDTSVSIPSLRFLPMTSVSFSSTASGFLWQ